MTASTLNQPATNNPVWYCLRTQTKREHIAAEGLRRRYSVECFCPRVRFRKLTARGPVWFVEAMFPGYFFAKFVYSEIHRHVSAAAGVQSIVRFGKHVPWLHDEAIGVLRSAASADVITIDPEIRVGDSVKVTEGPLQGLVALVTRVLPARDRVRVLLEFLGRDVEAEVPVAKVLSDARRGGA